ncbi:hypothetical protein H0A61_02433 [Koleobacter methoxysyntrophicus]|uniref:Stage III sporulation protein AF n=1 Tax=Koleobacter methoxysyntrophicus TaxID=2751313 RepID=A0A8A0RNR5_9FIRM|nr:stage III sporulation protein AF [Koleobacter methoxysyntrophicus]QSQ10041.1 hypothetical protein H0A61_02433 [Koleobacter methoxysyntrophicus]
MIEFLKNWIRSIVLIIFFAFLLEVFMPRSDLSRYIKVILGFLVIITVLSPVLSLFNLDFDFNQRIWAIKNDIEIQEITERGKSIQKDYNEQAIEQYKKGIVEQIKSHILDVVGLDESKIEINVEICEDIHDKDFGKLQGVEVIIDYSKKEEMGVKKIKPVEISIGLPNETKKASSDRNEVDNDSILINNIKKALSQFYNISHERVYIEVRKDEDYGAF